MSKIVIKVENLSKLYQLGEVGTGTISHDLNRFFAKIRGKEDPYQKVGQLNDRTKGAAKGEQIWALKDINFEVKQGEVLGIIGKNGAGKSTLLKLLSRVTAPTTGSIKVKGRVASLLEVGTGFHPEMTGRENIFMNGTIMGMTRNDIKNRLEAIVDFAGVAKYLDTPTKRYSSGMSVRLAFAVAAFLEPEILIVDEVLAVGDAEFQKRAIGKMQDISKGEGRTVLFVSHNMTAVSTLCTNALVIKDGGISFSGGTEESVDYYLEKVKENRTSTKWEENERPGNEYAELISAKIIDQNNKECKLIDIKDTFGVEIKFRVKQNGISLCPNIHFLTKNNEYIFVTNPNSSMEVKVKGVYKAIVWIPGNLLNEGRLIIGVALSSFNPTQVHFFENEVLVFDVTEKNYLSRDTSYSHMYPGFFRPKMEWTVQIVN
jgi:lipopolysaccharide transport system ATP-binding protein